MARAKLKVYVYLVFAMLFWGLSFVWFKTAVTYYNPITIIFIRLVISSVFLFAILKITRVFQKIKREDLPYFFLLAFTQPFCYFLGESFGLRLVSPTISSVIISTIPLFTPIAAYFFAREKVSASLIVGLILSFSGILLMIINPDLSLNASPKGILLLFGAVLAALVSAVVIKKIAQKYNAVQIAAFQNLIGAFYFLPLFLVFDYQSFIQVKPNKELIFAILKLAIFSSSFAYVFYNIGIKRLGITKAGIFTNLIPVFTGFFSYILLDEQFTALKITGMCIVLISLIYSQYSDFKKHRL